jgi:4'-phosphopantetheinyl transferase
VIALTRIGAIGIDIELKSRIFNYEKLKQLILSDSEHITFNKLDEEDKQSAFLRCWTRKEAFFKAVGSGLSSPLKELEVTFDNFSEPEILKT